MFPSAAPVRRFASGLIALAVVAFLPAVAGAQGFTAVHSRNGLDVWAVGDAGAWSRSFDGGLTWTAGTLATTRTLRGVAHQGLTVIVVADSGLVFRSVDNGVSWTRTVLAGTPDLKAVEMPGPTVAVIAGANETLLRSDDGGATWSPQGPGGAATLYGLRMTSALAGWAVGGGGRALRTVDGGASWVPVPTPTTNALYAVDAVGSRVWAVGAFGTALQSANDGGLWTPVNLRMETASDVRAVTLAGAAGVTLTGGGGFIRSSGDDGATWSFATHPLVAATTDYFAYGANLAWVTAGKTRAVVRTTNGGTTWALPTGTTTTWDWQLKRSAGNTTVRGNTFATSPQNRNAVWCVMGPSVFKSLDRGDSWTQIATIPGTISKTNSFYVSPRDSNLWVAACGSTDQIARTTNAGATWTNTLARDFTEYGMPLEMNPDRPDTLLFGPEDGRIYRSQNFGATWDTLSMPGFRSPCDIVISPDNNANVVVGDGVTGVGLAKIWQSENGGVGFADRYTGSSSETPTVWSSRLGNATLFATNWSSGGVWRSVDSGKNWAQVTTVTSAWGGATSTDDPKLVVFNRYAGSPNYVSTDGGTTFTSSNLTSPGSGYAVTTLDRSTILDMHSGGIFKLNVFYTVPAAGAQALALTAPDGGEAWLGGSVHAVTWTATNLALVTIEWRPTPLDAWLPVGQADGLAGTFAWTVPSVPTTQAQVRVRDAADGTPEDVSSATFTILAPQLALTAPNGGESWKFGESHAITWQGSGIADVALDYRGDEAAPWIELVATTPAAAGSWVWLVPEAPTATARVRVRQVGGGLEDTSDGLFALTAPQFLLEPSPYDFGLVPVAYGQWDTLHLENKGTGALVVSDITSDNAAFRVTRTSFVVAPGSMDTLAVWFTPTGAGPDSALLTITADDSAAPHAVRLRGDGGVAVGAEARPVAYAFEMPRPNPFSVETSIRFALPEPAHVALEVFDLGGRRVAVLVDGPRDAGLHAVSFRPRASGALRSGVYFVRLTAGPFARTQKILYLAP